MKEIENEYKSRKNALSDEATKLGGQKQNGEKPKITFYGSSTLGSYMGAQGISGATSPFAPSSADKPKKEYKTNSGFSLFGAIAHAAEPEDDWDPLRCGEAVPPHPAGEAKKEAPPMGELAKLRAPIKPALWERGDVTDKA